MRASAAKHRAGLPDLLLVEADVAALGDALRTAERFPESVAAYDAAIALIETPMPVHWPLYYTRGIANERAGNWDAAEADFRAALKLEPDQPLVLNYLGYSMVEKQVNLDEALGMIEKASKAEPDDGYITDSLGWVLYRLGRYDEAVKPMLRAVERKLLWLSSWTIHHANHLRPSRDKLKVGGHQASCASVAFGLK